MTTFLITDYIWSKTIDRLIQTQISEWQQHYNNLDIDKNGSLSIDEFSSGHQNIIKVIGHHFFDGKKEITFDKYCLYMVLYSDQDDCFEINEVRIRKVYEKYCKKRQTEYNGRIKISDFIKKTNDLLTIEQFEDILQHMSNRHSFDFNPGEINYKQFKEFVESMLTFALMDRDNNRSISSNEVKIFVELMGKCKMQNEIEDEVSAFLESHDLDQDGEVSVYEFLLTKYVPMYNM